MAKKGFGEFMSSVGRGIGTAYKWTSGQGYVDLARKGGEEGNKMIDAILDEPTDYDTLDKVINSGKALMDSLIGAAPGTADELRSGVKYDLKTVFDAIHANNFCDFNTKMGMFMDRLMSININEKNVTLAVLGQDAAYNGDSTLLPAWVQRPSYAEGRNYLDYVDTVNYSGHGDMTTRRTDNIHRENYGNVNELYRTTEFLYPDENGTGQFRNKWDVNRDRNSLLYKTKRLFDERKIKTLISRFGSNADPTSVDLDYTPRKGSTTGGESRGRNLLNKSRSGRYNGYNDPYCRVWTHHHKFDRLNKLIRPFTGGDGEGTTTTDLETMHSYFDVKPDSKDKKLALFNKKGWKYSVLSRDSESHYTGFVNITPKFLGGAGMNINTKQCMFSIENLAWRGYNPYEFEKALSWEQRGPLGGRIMWFPPYGISFSETSTARWSNNTFIGRGEDVYTYINTQRTGNLNFLMVIDHPSVLDYATWHDEGTRQWGGERGGDSNSLTDEEILQFFAGCDTANPNHNDSLFSRTKHTPLTDEYTEELVLTDDIRVAELNKTEDPQNVEPDPEDAKNGTKEVVFYLFFPNNYSGYYEWPNKENTGIKNYEYYDDFFRYLMAGKNCWGFSGKHWHGPGYEMADPKGLSGKVEEGYFNEEHKEEQSFWTVIDKWGNGKDCSYEQNKGHTCYTGKNNKCLQWGYRVDTRYCNEGKYFAYNKPTRDEVIHEKRDHKLPEASYTDKSSGRRNITPKEPNKEGVYSAALIFGVLDGDNGYVINQAEDNEKKDYLISLFKNHDIVSIKAEGNASQDGRKVGKRNNIKEGDANVQLAKDRAHSAALWVQKKLKKTFDKDVDDSKVSSDGKYQNGDGAEPGENSTEAKNDRFAKVTITFKTEESEDAAASGQTNASNLNGTAQTATVNATTPSEQSRQNQSDAIEKKKNEIIGKLQVCYDKIVGYSKKFKYKESGKDGEGYYYTPTDKKYIGIGAFLFGLGDGNVRVKTLNPNCGYRKLLYKKDENYDNQLMLVGYYDLNGNEKVKISNGDYSGEDSWGWLDRGKQIYEIPTTFAPSKCNKDGNVERHTNACIDYYGVIDGLVKKAKCNEEGPLINKLAEEVDKIVLLQDESGNFVNKGIFTKYYETLRDGQFTKSFGEDEMVHSDETPKVFIHEKTDRGSLNEGEYGKTYDKLNYPEAEDIFNTAQEASRLEQELYKLYGEATNFEEKQEEEQNEQQQKIEALDSDLDGWYYKYYNLLLDFNQCLKDQNDKKHQTRLKNNPDTPVTRDEVESKPDVKGAYSKLDEYVVEWLGNEEKKEENERCSKYGYIKTNFSVIKEKIAAAKEKLEEAETSQSSEENATANNGAEVGNDKVTQDDGGDVLVWDDTSKYVGYNPVMVDGEDETHLYRDINKGNYWVEVEEGTFQRIDKQVKSRFKMGGINEPGGVEEGAAEDNDFRYDQEYYFFRQLEQSDPIVFDRLMKKLQYFDPAFHSMTPEGFNARLTFLNQCTRQGNTITMSDVGGKTANNLAFGRPPFCVLRLGDFYNQMIVINSINFDYSVSDGITWDLNPEGAGVQPMLCRVSLNFTFIGGGDMAGPVRRLQNAMSFNYYANTRLYDNRADRVKYNSEDNYTVSGAVDWELDSNEKQYAYTAAMYKDVDLEAYQSLAKQARETWVQKKKENQSKANDFIDMENKAIGASGAFDINKLINSNGNSRFMDLAEGIANKTNLELNGNSSLNPVVT